MPIVLSKASLAERYAPGDRIVLAGIGSGLNCTAAAVAVVKGVSEALYPFESNVLDRDGLAYHYLDEGTGDPVLMVHGNPVVVILPIAISSRRCGPIIAASCPTTSAWACRTSPATTVIATSLASRIDDLERLVDTLALDRQAHAGAARLGRHDRHGLSPRATRSASAASCC